MSFNAEALVHRLVELENFATTPDRYVIAYSGGLDSSVLAHALLQTRPQHGKSLLAIHVDHRLHGESKTWAAHCRNFADKMALDFICEVVDVDGKSGKGTEAAARDARYTALRGHVGDGDWLLCAHHQDDQAETLLMNLLRGSGPAGVAAMQSIREFGEGWLVRPFLGVSRDDLATYAEVEGLAWVDDPSNDDHGFDRNFLRREVMPLLAARWPHCGEKLARSAELARDAANLLMDLADTDIASIGGTRGKLPVAALAGLSVSRQQNLLRRAVQLADLSAPAAAQLRHISKQLLPAREDAAPLVNWPGGEARRYRDTLYLMPSVPVASFEGGESLGTDSVAIGPGLGELTLCQGTGPGLSDRVVSRGLSLRRRVGGEEIRPVGQAHTRKLKKLLQEERIVPWLRDSLPLVYCGDELVAVADLWIAASAAAENGRSISWHGRPELY